MDQSEYYYLSICKFYSARISTITFHKCLVVSLRYKYVYTAGRRFLLAQRNLLFVVVYFLLGNPPASEFYMPTFRYTLSVPSSYASPCLWRLEQTEGSETSAYKIQAPGNHPEGNIQHTEHGESLKSRITFCCLCSKCIGHRLQSFANRMLTITHNKIHRCPQHCTVSQSTALTYFKIQVSFQPQAQDKYSGLGERICFLLQILEYHSN
jgi:hypothetical protein